MPTRAPRPADNAVLATFVDEEESRATRTSPIEATQLDISRDNRDKQVLGLPGTVTFYLGYRGSPAMATLRQLVKTPATSPPAADVKKLLALPPRDARVTKDEAVRAIKREPVLADIRYAGKTLVSRVLAQKTKLTVAVCPYNGGRLNSSAFSLVEHVKDGRTEALDAVAIVCAPPLTAAEKAAADKVRAEESEMNIGVALSERMCETIGLFLLGIVAGAAVWAAVDHFVGSWNGILRAEQIYDPVNLKPAEIDQRGPAGSARDLLQARRNMLSKQRG